MSHLSQCIAIEKDVKEKAAQALGHAQGQFGNGTLLSGIARTYTPKDEQGEQLPPESTRVRVKVKDELARVKVRLADLFDVTATKDYTNCVAKADVMVDGTALLKGVPATYLLFLEKQLGELAAFVKRIPTLDASEEWDYDQAQDCWATPPSETIRTKKDKKSQIAFAGNEHHPPQFIVWDEDVPQGRWKTVKYSGAMTIREQNDISERIERLQRAVKFAREEANRSEAKQQVIGDTLLQYVFG
jgi:ribosomal protein L31E